MPDYERDQPSNAREIKEVLSRDESLLEAKSKQMGLNREAPPEIRSIPKASERMIERETATEAPTLDHLLTHATERQWDEFAKRLSDGLVLASGDKVSIDLPPGHNIQVMQTNRGLVTAVDGQPTNSDIAHELMEQRSVEINEALRRRLQQEEERRRREALREEGKAHKAYAHEHAKTRYHNAMVREREHGESRQSHQAQNYDDRGR